MKRLKIYFAAAIRGGRTDAARYQQLIAFLQTTHQVLTEHIGATDLTATGETALTDAEIYQRDLHWLTTCDVVVAETPQPSLGVGYELAYAEKIGKPVLILQQQGPQKLSAMISGAPYFQRVFTYRTVAQAQTILQRKLGFISGTKPPKMIE
ncbi:MAG: nucleoside 2-deoxyribosyltransferase [Lactobacillus sp.]|nr:MAG: nucleoside 2-deoxyribosyltransferase [Lactobacillus sp.]